MKNVADTETIHLDQLVYTWAERTLTGTGNGVVLRSTGWPTGNSTAADAALADFVEYLPAKLQHRLGSGRTPPLGADFWEHTTHGNVVSVHRYLGVDSAGRGGRSIVHVLLDRERRLDARAALELCQSPLVTSEWDLKAEPVHNSEGIHFLPGRQTSSGRRHNGDLLLATLAGVVEYLIHGRQIVFTHDHDVDALGLLDDCLRILPRDLASSLTFSTFRGIPQRSKCAVSFASTIFSEVLPKADTQKTYAHLTAADQEERQTPHDGHPRPTGFSATALDLATELLRLHQAGGPACPPDISSVQKLDQWLNHQSLALRPVDSLQLADCAALLALPAKTSWVLRDRIIDRAAELTATATPTPASRPSFLEFLSASEKEAFGRTLHAVAVTALASSPGRALSAKHQADALGYPAQRLADLAIPVLDRLTLDGPRPEPALEQFIAEITPSVPLSQRFVWASRPIFQASLLKEWEPTALAVATRTWTEPRWAHEHTAMARAVALRYPGRSAELIATALTGYAASPGGIDSVLALDQAPQEEAFTEVIRNLVSLPGIREHQLRRLAGCHLLPSATRAEIVAIIDPPLQEAPADKPGPAPLSVPRTAVRPTFPRNPHTGFTPTPPIPEQAPTQPWVQSRWDGAQDNAAQRHQWTAADRDDTFAQSVAPSAGPQPESSAAQQPKTARRRTLVRMLAVVLSTVAGYLVAETRWSLFAWPPALLIVVVSLVLMMLPIKHQPKATDARRGRFLRSKLKGRHQPLKTGSRFSWKARKPSE